MKAWLEFKQADSPDAMPSEHTRLMWEQCEDGEVLEPSKVPDRFYKPRSAKPAMKPDTAHIMNAGFLFVSPECTSVLRSFEIGAGQLIPVRLFKSDRTTELPEGWCILNVAAKKNTFRPEASSRPKNRSKKRERYVLPPNPVDDEQTFGPGALQGVDLWMEERWAPGFLFLTDRLMQALRAAGVAEPWQPTRCKVVA